MSQYSLVSAAKAPMKAEKKTAVKTEPLKTDSYSVTWHHQANGTYTLTTILKPENELKGIVDKVRYLDDVFGDLFENFTGNRYFGYRLRVIVNDRIREVQEYGSFTPCRIVLMLIDIGLTDVFRQKEIEIELVEIVY